MNEQGKTDQVIMITPEHIKELAKHQTSTLEKVKNYILILVSTGSILAFGFYYDNINQYREQIRQAETRYEIQAKELKEMFEVQIAYDAATQNKVSELIGKRPEIKIELTNFVKEVKIEARREMEKRKLGTEF